MRKPFVAGNWKMNKTVAEAQSLVQDMLPGLQAIQSVEIVLCPTATALMAVSDLIKGTGIGAGAQNMHWEKKGAFTGELSPEMVKELCDYIIIGHSERREFFHETDETVNKKIKAALAQNLTPIVCIGETLVQNEAGETSEVVTRQLEEGLKGITNEEAQKIVVAYEPIWAIGTGKAASSEEANLIIGNYIRATLAKVFNKETAESIRVLYGGSVKPENAAEFFNQPEIDGALVGGASLKPDFIEIAKAAA